MSTITLKPGTITWCRVNRRCYTEGCDNEATMTEEGSFAPYCLKCHRKHAAKWAKLDKKQS